MDGCGSGGWDEFAGEDLEQCGLAGAAGAHDGDDLMGLRNDADVLEDVAGFGWWWLF